MDNSIPDLMVNETFQEDTSNLNRLKQSYLLLKKKISGTHELIKQYNDKLKECDRFKQDLDASNKQMKKVTCNYNSTLAKVIKLELQNTEYKKNIEILTTQVNDHNIKTAADQQYIQQLICKIKDTEESQNDKLMQYDLEKSSFQVKVKELEQELKNVKKSHDIKIKKLEKKSSSENENKPKLKDVGTNTALTKDTIMQKPIVAEKCVLTEEFYNVKNDVYPIFCNKCEVILEPPPLEKICQVMTNSCPKLIEKISSPLKKLLQVSPSINGDECKTEDLLTITDTSQPHLQHNSHTNFIPTNPLPLHPMPLNRPDCCNNLSIMAGMMNQGNYYIGPTPVKPLSMTNSNATIQNNHCESMTSSSVSIISSLQKKIDALETKVKKKLNKTTTQQNSNCCHSHQPNSNHMYDMNSSMQFSLLELWKRMTDLYENKEKKNHNMPKKWRSHKLSRIKHKRLQSMNTGSWKVESIAKKTEQCSLRKRLKKPKYRYSTLFDKSDSSLNNTEDLEKLNNDCDTDSSVEKFHDTDNIKANMDLSSESIPLAKASTSTSKASNTNMNELEVAGTEQDSVECSKSAGGETDSGILSDSVESGKLMKFEADIETCSELIEHKNAVEMSSIQNECDFTEDTKSVKSKLIDNSPIKVISPHLIKPEKPIQENNISEILRKPDEHIEQTEGMNFNTSSSIRKRKRNNLSELKKLDNRQKLLKKLKDLKKNKVANTLQNVAEHTQSSECEKSNIFHKSKILDSETFNENDYTPKKKPRIAHVPRNTVIEQRKTSLQPKKQLEQNTENTSAQNRQQNCINSNESKENNNELQNNCNIEIEESQSIFSNVNSNNTQDNLKDAIFDELIPASKDLLHDSEHEDSLTIDVNNSSLPNTESNNNSSNETIELNEAKTESNNVSEHLNEEHENNSLVVTETIEVNSMIQQELLNSNDSNFINTLEINDKNKTNINGEETTNTSHVKEVSDEDHGPKLYCPFKMLQQYINQHAVRNSKEQIKKLQQVRLVADKFVMKQLEILKNSEWETSVHWDVIEKLKSTCSARIIANGIINFLSKEDICNEGLDKSHTPPAPLMSKTQQKIAALLIDLEKSKPKVFQLVQAGIEYKVLRLNQSIQRTVIESLSRMYTVFARIKKDRERVRIFCCDALYCLGLNMTFILYTVLTCWPEVFPNNDSNKLLPKCMAHLIITQQAVNYPKLNALKNLISIFYKYPLGTSSTDILKELLMTLQEKCNNEVEIAIILLAKREGTAWTYKNIIKGALLPMIINNKIPNTYRAFCLLGTLMRTFPIKDKDNEVGEIMEQLCDLINSGEGSDEQNEGVISALLNLSRHNFDKVVQNVLKWIPSAPLQDRTIEQFQSLFHSRDRDFWRSYLRKNKQLSDIQKMCET